MHRSLRSVRLPHVMAGTGVVLLAIAFAGVGDLLLRERRATLEAATTAQSNLTLGLERDIMRNIDIYDLSLRSAAAGMQLVDPSMTTAAQNAILFDGSSAARHFRPILIADDEGTVLWDGGALKPRLANVTDRPFFAAHRDGLATGLLVDLYLRGGITGQPYLSLSRRVSGPDGSFRGTVSGGLALDYLDQIFSRYALPEGGALALVGLDGRLVAGYPHRVNMAGRDVSGGGLVDQARLADVSSFATASVVDGTTRIATVRRLGNLPFFLAVGAPISVIYAPWERRAWTIGAGMVAFATVSGLLLSALVRELGRRRSAERAAVAACHAATASQRRLVTYVDQLADGLLAIRIGPDNRFVYERVNAAAAAMLDIRPEDAIGRQPGEVWPPEVAELIAERLARCLAADGPVRYEHTHRGRHQTRVLRFVLAPVREAVGGPVTLLLASLRDVTEAVEMEARLRHSQRLEAIGHLTAGVAHDFNNMLQAQLGALQIVLTQGQDLPNIRRYAQLALTAGERGVALTQSLLAYSRKQILAPRPVPVEEMLARLQQLLARTLEPRIEFRARVEPDGAAPFADMAQLESALLNLALNARDAMPEGGALVIEASRGTRADTDEARDAPASAAAGCYRLAVSDTGIGMPPDIAAKSCEPFFTTKDVGKSSGLGLSMVQGFVQQSGGAMRIASEPGQGTRVELWLPLATPNHEAGQATRAEPDADAPGETSPGFAIKPGSGAAPRLLLVDDDPDVLAVTAALLEDSGFEVVQAATGLAALSRLEVDGPFDGLVTDFSMPGMDGAELVRRVIGLRPGLPTLILSGYTEAEVLRGLPAHVHGARKPISGDALAQRIAMLLDGSEPVRRPAAMPQAA